MKYFNILLRGVLAFMVVVLSFMMLPSNFAFAETIIIDCTLEENQDDVRCTIPPKVPSPCNYTKRIFDPYMRTIIPKVPTYSDTISIRKQTSTDTNDVFTYRVKAYQENEIQKTLYSHENAGVVKLYSLDDELLDEECSNYLAMPDGMVIVGYPVNAKFNIEEQNNILDGYTFGYDHLALTSIYEKVFDNIKALDHIEYRFTSQVEYRFPENTNTGLFVNYNGRMFPLLCRGEITAYNYNYTDYDIGLFIDGTYNEYLDLSEQYGHQVAEGTYEFTLSSGESATIDISEGYKYEIWELDKEGWELVSINNDSDLNKVEGVIGETGVTEYVFSNKKANETEIIDESYDGMAPSIDVPNTGESTGGVSAVRTGIVAFAVIATFGRVVYLIRKYRK